jgi:GNAT superfamily N-acetyltransferase
MSYEFSPVDTSPQHIGEYAALLSAVFTDTKKFTTGFLDWQYAQNPAGKVVGYDARMNGLLAAHYVTIPAVYTLNGVQKKGLLSLNTATHPQHQGKGLFTQLATKTYELAASMGYEFVIGVANQNSTHGFLKKLGFYLVSPLDVKIGTGKTDLQNEAAHYKWKSLWTKESMDWRLANPSAHYYKKNDLLLTPSGKLNIYAVLAQSDLIAANTQVQEKNAFSKMWIGIADRKRLGIYFTLPDRLKPSPLNLIFKDLSGKLPVLNKEDVYFELLDFDAY